MLNEYELTVILLPELPEDESRAIREMLEGIVADFNGTVLRKQDWGVRKLAYPIQKQTRGHYYYWRFVAEPSCVAELERKIRIEAKIIRFLTVRLEQNVTLEEARQRVAESKPPPLGVTPETEAQPAETPAN